jgi:hypothetical protein
MSQAPVAAPAAPQATSEAIPSLETQVNQTSTEVAGNESSDSMDLDAIAKGEDTAQEQKPTETKEQKELKKKLKLKVRGREREEEIDFNDEDKLRKMLEKAYGADETFQEASKTRKQMEAFAKLLQEDPVEALKHFGHDVDAIAQKYLESRIEEMQKSPEQLELEQLRKEVEKERKMREKIEQERVEAQKSQIEQEYARKLDDEITSSLAKANLPKSTYVVKRIAENLMIALQKGYTDVSVDDVLPVVDKQIKSELRELFGILPEDLLEQFVGNDMLTKLRKNRVAKAKTAPVTASSVKSTGVSEALKAESNKREEKLNSRDFFKNLGTTKI